MFSLAKTWPLPVKSQTSEKEERSYPLEGPIQIHVCFPIYGPRRNLGPQSEEKEVVAWLFSTYDTKN